MNGRTDLAGEHRQPDSMIATNRTADAGRPATPSVLGGPTRAADLGRGTRRPWVGTRWREGREQGRDQQQATDGHGAP
jgi:hypothetical protein